MLVQLLIILSAAHICGRALQWFGQPRVVGEMVAGVILGPIVFGAIFPAWHAKLFGPDELVALDAVGQLGLVLFMFIIGVELRAPIGWRARLKAASWVGALSVLVPLALGLALAPMLYPHLAPGGLAFWPFAWFVAAAMAITAFPVMARILKDRADTPSRVGQLSLSAAAFVDVAAWVVVSLVTALSESGGSWIDVMKTTAGLLTLVLVATGILRPFYSWLFVRRAREGSFDGALLAVLLIGLFATAVASDWLHLHPVFGAFLFGACLPRDDVFRRSLSERLEQVAIVALMPVFFVVAGLNTTSGVFAAANAAALALILLAAVVGKVGGAAVGARVAGYSWRESFAVGSLMNARGLMELVVIKIGLDQGLIGPEMFTILLIVAIVTTLMTGPLLTLIAAPDEPAASLARSKSA